MPRKTKQLSTHTKIKTKKAHKTINKQIVETTTVNMQQQNATQTKSENKQTKTNKKKTYKCKCANQPKKKN